MLTHAHTYTCLYVYSKSMAGKQAERLPVYIVLGAMGYFVLFRWERKLLLPWMQMKITIFAKTIGNSSQS